MYRSEITQFRDKLFLADLASVQDDAERTKLGITRIVSFLVGGLWDASLPEGWCNRSDVVWIEQRDGAHVTDERLEEFIRVMTQFEQEGQVVVLHCHAGISRTPSFAIFWEMYKQVSSRQHVAVNDELLRHLGLRELWSMFEDEITAKRPWTQPHWVLKDAMLDFLDRKFGVLA